MRDAESLDGTRHAVPTDMSKNINVNPGQYKVAGRERQGDDISPDQHKARESIKTHELHEQSRAKKKPQGRKRK